jgi:tRNA-uridine 2-sulfurtransferase
MLEGLPPPASAGTIIIGMSGGVDSAVAALLLRDAGYSVQGLFMSNWEDDGYCTTATDYQDARQTCQQLGLPLHRANFAAEYRDRVFQYFLNEYAANRTPNPDVLCNREIKFGVCLDYMHRLGAKWIATGHYARVRHTPDGAQLLKGLDDAKDQSYFLHSVKPEALQRTLFPLGDLHKRDVRRIAHAAGLPVFDKPDSTGICFIGERPFQEFLSRYLRTDPGPIETDAGRVVGEHAGLPFYTLGQRSGLKIGGRAGSSAAPWYVADKLAARNALIVVQDHNHPLLLSTGLDLEQAHWLAPELDEAMQFDCGVKTRYRQADIACSATRLGEARWRVTLRNAARAVTPGQFAVFYQGARCLGGGVIARRFNNLSVSGTAESAYNTAFTVEGS